MSDNSANASDGFEPPKYLASLITAVNTGAEAAERAALLFALVAVYLFATAFSASDEDLLLGRTMTISQVGAALPVSFSFAVAPFVFVFLHFNTLVRYDMLASKVRQLLTELNAAVRKEEDRERCKQLLASVEFIRVLVAQPGSRQYSRILRGLVWFAMAIVPVSVLLLVQINALRYQSEQITGLQRLGLAFDLGALVWFFHRNPLNRSGPQPAKNLASTQRLVRLLLLPAAVMVLNLVYLNVVPPGADVRLVRYQDKPNGEHGRNISTRLADGFSAPLDVWLCHSLSWGCRYLRLDHRTFVSRVWSNTAIGDLRSGDTDQERALKTIEGVVLRDRSLRFAVLNESSLFAGDLSGVDLQSADLTEVQLRSAKMENALLQHAVLQGAILQDANLEHAHLEGANLQGAQLRNANLIEAELRGAILNGAKLEDAKLQNADLRDAELMAAHLERAILAAAGLQNAKLYNAHLDGANLHGASLEGADLTQARLRGAYLAYARLQAANLSQGRLLAADLTAAQLQGAYLADVRLQGADLFAADLQGADLTGARLQSANLFGARFQGADLSQVRLWRASFDKETDLGLSNLRGADFATPMTADEKNDVYNAAKEIQNNERKVIVKKRLDQLFDTDQSVTPLLFTASPQRQVLVSDSKNPVFGYISTTWLITRPTSSYTGALVDLLVNELASRDSAIAEAIASRAHNIITSVGTESERRLLYSAIACRHLSNEWNGPVKLRPRTITLLFEALRDSKIKC